MTNLIEIQNSKPETWNHRPGILDSFFCLLSVLKFLEF